MSRYVKDELGIWHLSAGGDSETNFVGTTAQWEALTAVQKAQYLTVDLIDDYNGYLIDDVPVENSPNFVRSGGVYAMINREPIKEDFTFTLGTNCSWASDAEHYCYHLSTGITKIGGKIQFPTLSTVGDVAIGTITKYIPKNNVSLPVANGDAIAFLYINATGDVKIRRLGGGTINSASFEVTY